MGRRAPMIRIHWELYVSCWINPSRTAGGGRAGAGAGNWPPGWPALYSAPSKGDFHEACVGHRHHRAGRLPIWPEILIAQGYESMASSGAPSSFNTERIDHLYLDPTIPSAAQSSTTATCPTAPACAASSRFARPTRSTTGRPVARQVSFEPRIHRRHRRLGQPAAARRGAGTTSRAAASSAALPGRLVEICRGAAKPAAERGDAVLPASPDARPKSRASGNR